MTDCHNINNPLNNKIMNKAEFKAIKMIAEKLDWKSVNFETIKQMVRNQQALELDTVGECDDEEDTLLSIALWDKEKIISTMYVSSYQDLVMWGVYSFCDSMGITPEVYSDMVTYYNCIQPEVICDEYTDWLNEYYSDYDAEIMRDVMWMNNNC